MANILFYQQFKIGKVGATGKTILIDVDRIARADGTRTAVVTGGATSEGVRGVYRYLLTGADLQTYDYAAVLYTADTSVDDQEIPSLWTRWSEAVATDASGQVAANGVNGNVTGSVGSVTGAVGSVTGNVGGNVVGSTASVTGAVGSVTGDVGGNVGGKVLGGGGGVIGGDGVRAASVTGNVGGNVAGSVGSVTGAVGSVTGGVGGDVTGSVGSVVGAVTLAAGSVTAIDTQLSDAHGAGAWGGGSGGGVVTGWGGTALQDLVDAVAGANPDDYATDPNCWAQRSIFAASGSSGTDWTDAERKQIRHRLGIDGLAVAPSADPSLAMPGDAMTLEIAERAAIGSAVWANSMRTLSAFGFTVTVGTNQDKAGYSLTQAFPANFPALAITGGGAVTAGTVADKAGYTLSPTGLDAIPITEPAGRLAVTYREMAVQLWRRWYKHSAKIAGTGNAGRLVTYKDSGAEATSQNYTTDGNSEDLGNAS